MLKLWYWLADYYYALVHGHGAIFRRPPSHYTEKIVPGKPPVILIPGLYERWSFLRAIAEPLSHLGHPVYVVPGLGVNSGSIASAAQVVRGIIGRENLTDVVLIGHSKGGLIAKELLARHNGDRRIRHAIAIASPFGGSTLAGVLPLTGAIRGMRPSDPAIKTLAGERSVNARITSIFGTFDNHVWPDESARLEGAKNVCLPCWGHHRILFDPQTTAVVLEEMESLS